MVIDNQNKIFSPRITVTRNRKKKKKKYFKNPVIYVGYW